MITLAEVPPLWEPVLGFCFSVMMLVAVVTVVAVTWCEEKGPTVDEKSLPGSADAIRQGCVCPVIDNRKGWIYRGDRMYVMRADCPVHGVIIGDGKPVQTDLG